MKLANLTLQFKRRFYGIRKRLLIYSLGSIIIIMSLVVGLISKIVEQHIKDLTIEKYQYLNEKVIAKISNSFQASDELFKKYIDHSAIQATLENRKIDERDKKEVQRMLAYIDFPNMNRAAYIDNKGNVYGAKLVCFNYMQFVKSDLYKVLDGTYSTTKWRWQKDSLFGMEDEALFMMRYIRHMEYASNPGVFILKMDDSYFKDMINELDDGVSYLFWDADYNLCYEQGANGIELCEDTYKKILEEVKTQEYGVIKQFKEGVLFVNQEAGSNIQVAVLVPQEKINAVVNEVRYVMIAIWLIFCIIAIVAVNYLARGFVAAIKEINDTMQAFNGTDYSLNLEIKTETELDEIAQCYNQMIGRIRQLMLEVQLREKALRMSELDSLMYQINPHFLYNTLDNIYMMARLNHDEQMKKMIEALSKFLRIGLSNGKQEITVWEELQHIKSYMEIMKMRGSQEFRYSITCDEEVKEAKVIKLILQPVIENSIKYGFDEVEGEARIDIDVKQEEEMIVFSIRDNGGKMDSEILEKLNQLMYKPYDEEVNIKPSKDGGYGIKNVVNRLKLRYKEKFLVRYESNQTIGTVCYIKIPKENL